MPAAGRAAEKVYPSNEVKMLPGIFRLKKRYDFSRAYYKGRAKACTEFVLYRYYRKGREIRIGFSASKKLGHAVARNRIKRIFRHAAYSNLDKFLPGGDYIFVIRKAALSRSYTDIETQIKKMLKEE